MPGQGNMYLDFCEGLVLSELAERRCHSPGSNCQNDASATGGNGALIECLPGLRVEDHLRPRIPKMSPFMLRPEDP